MRLQCFGAARTTTGSMHLLEINGSRILLDCGLFQGRRKEAFERNRNFPVDLDSIDVCVLSHAHIDHSGNLPTLVKKGYKGRIVTTPPTRDLIEIMLADSGHIQEQDVKYVNRKRERQGKALFEPLYTPEDVPPVLAAADTLPYGESREIVPGVVLTFRDAGHILGSAFSQLDVTENGRTRRLFFTGDIGRNNLPILKDPEVLHDVDILLTESTYGNRTHPTREDVKAKLAELIGFICQNRSRLVVPSFSVGRTQQILYFLNELSNEGAIDCLPVYVDSPLSTKATEVHRAHPECYDKETRTLLEAGDDPFWFPNLAFVANVEESKKINHTEGPLLIISASGMCEGGRILHHLKNTVEDERNAILIVGYQAEYTLGRRLVDGVSPIRIFGEEFELRAQVHQIQALSAHADRDEMRDYFTRMGPAVEHAFIVHGELEANQAMAAMLDDMGARKTTIPERGEIYEV